MASPPESARPSEAIIDLSALRANLAVATELADGREVIAVVKADAYGHGAATVAGALVESGCPRLAVLTVAEGVALRRVGVEVPILVLVGARTDEEAAQAVAADLTPTLHDDAGRDRVAAAARAAGVRIAVHVEVDTGMHRMGVPAPDAIPFLLSVEAEAGLDLEGVFTHFARADEPDLAPTLAQAARFRRILTAAADAGLRPAVVHAANSAALMWGKALSEALPEATAVRPGLLLYGVRPAPHLGGELAPVMTLRASVVAVRDVEPGGGVGYGSTWCAPADGARVATLSLGYADGIPWSTANRGTVWLAGAHRAIVGRVSMDSIAVHLGDADASVGDPAVIFGRLDEPGTPSVNPRSFHVEEVARSAGTLHYELLVRVGERVPRVDVG